MNYERQLRRLRQRVFDYPETKEEQVSRIFAKLKAKLEPVWKARHSDDPYYGLPSYLKLEFMSEDQKFDKPRGK